MDEKKSFVLYLDSYPMFAMLTPEQRGWLFTAIFAFAQRLSREEGVQAGEGELMQQVMDSIQELNAETRMAFSFVASAIFRDTQKWYAQRRARTERKNRQGAGPVQGSEAGDKRVREDMARMRRLMQEAFREEREHTPQWAAKEETV